SVARSRSRSSVTSDADRLRRFRREAQLLASLMIVQDWFADIESSRPTSGKFLRGLVVSSGEALHAVRRRRSARCSPLEEKQPMAKKRSIVKPVPRRPAPCCAAGVCDPERTQGLQAPVPQGSHSLVTLNGP